MLDSIKLIMTRSIGSTIATTSLIVLCFTCFSLSAIAALQAPTASPATNIKNDSFTANWTSVAGATSYRLDVSKDVKFVTFVPGYSNVDVGGTSLLVKGLSCNDKYYYRVRSVDSNGQSEYSAIVTVQLCNR